MRLCFALLFMLALPLSAQAQKSLDGAWMLTFMMHEGAPQTMGLTAETVQDTLRLTVTSDHGDRALEEVSYQDNALKFVFPTGHGSVSCALFRKKGNEDFSGICEGAMGEIPTKMKRQKARAGDAGGGS